MNTVSLPQARKINVTSIRMGTVVIKQEKIEPGLDTNQALNNLEKAVKEGVFKKKDE